MKKFLTSRVPLLLVIISLALFNVVFWAIVGKHIDALHIGLWIAYGFLTTAFVVVGAVTFIPVKNKNTIASFSLIFIVTTAFLGLSLLINIIVMAVNSDDFVWPLVLNAIVLFVYMAAMLIAYKHLSRVDDNTVARETRMRDWRTVSINVTGLFNLTDDAEVLAALKKFREDIDCSSTASSEATKETEKELDEQIITIKSLLKAGSDKETVLKAIRVAGGILKTRNQLLMTMR